MGDRRAVSQYLVTDSLRAGVYAYVLCLVCLDLVSLARYIFFMI